MQAMVLKGFGDAGNLVAEELPQPEIRPGEVLIKVQAIGINPVDVKTRMGKAQAVNLQKENPMILGWDVSGIVEATALSSSVFVPGDAVFGTVRFPGCGNAYAEYVSAPAAQLALKPRHISHRAAAAASLAALTAWKALVTCGRIEAGDRVLIHGAAGGVGHFAVQIARYFGARITGTASAKNRAFVLGLGADSCIDYKTERFETIAHDFDIIVDSVGGENFARSVTVLKPNGIIINLPSDKAAEARRIAREKNVRNFYQMEVASDGKIMKKIASLLAENSLKPHIGATVPFRQIAEAHRMIESGTTVGKIVATI